jgi:hypothetical protein
MIGDGLGKPKTEGAEEGGRGSEVLSGRLMYSLLTPPAPACTSPDFTNFASAYGMRVEAYCSLQVGCMQEKIEQASFSEGGRCS